MCLPTLTIDRMTESASCLLPADAACQANMAAFTVIPSRSAAVRSYLESHLLEALAGRQASVALSGFIFFGSSVLLSDKVGAWTCCC